MRLIIAIVQDKDVGLLLEALTRENFRATKLASTGGFLREGNTTLLIGVENEREQAALGIISRTCKSRTQLITPLSPMGGPAESFVPVPVEIQVGGATAFILDVERFIKF